MPILLKKIEASIISLFGDDSSSNFTAPVRLVQKVVGEAGIEDYIKLASYEALTQDFSNIEEGSFVTLPSLFGLGECATYDEINITY